MKRRQLTDEEKALCQNSIKRLEREIHNNQVLIKHANVMLEGLLKYNYDQKTEEYMLKKRTCNENIARAQATITELKIQMQEGVYSKKKQRVK